MQLMCNVFIMQQLLRIVFCSWKCHSLMSALGVAWSGAQTKLFHLANFFSSTFIAKAFKRTPKKRGNSRSIFKSFLRLFRITCIEWSWYHHYVADNGLWKNISYKCCQPAASRLFQYCFRPNFCSFFSNFTLLPLHYRRGRVNIEQKIIHADAYFSMIHVGNIFIQILCSCCC